MSDSTRRSVLRRLQKLLRLADRGGTAGEAALAAGRAQALMDQYRVSAVDVACFEGEIKIGTTGFGNGPSLELWQAELGAVIAEANGCRAVHLPFRGNIVVVFIGLPPDIQLCEYLCWHLGREIGRIAREQPERADHAWAENFCRGAVRAIQARFDERRRQRESKVTSAALEIVDQRCAGVDDWLRKNGAKLAAREQPMTDCAAASMGLRAGREIPINPGVTAGDSRRT